MVSSLEVQVGAEMLRCLHYWDMASLVFIEVLIILISCTGGTLVSHGEISVGDLTSLLLYTVYVGSGLQMLT